ncbi:MAG TPA: hypothetical protein VL381_04250 [Rhodocyclaceae bacterium]|jgi:hypothetical protein|nr:hypothetical protein [Rhodocyclaceae bacterium]
MATTRIITIGTGKDYASLNTFRAWLNAQDLVAQNLYIEAHVYENQSIASGAVFIGPQNSDMTRYCLIRPAPGLGVHDLNPTGMFDWKPNGILLNFVTGSYYALRISSGVVLQGFRITTSATGGATQAPLSLYQSVYVNLGTYQCGLRRNIFLADTSTAPCLSISGGLAGGTSAVIADNLFITETVASNAALVELSEPCVIERNTFVRRNNTTMRTVTITVNYDAHTPIFRNNAIIGHSPESIRFVMNSAIGIAARNASVGNYADGGVTILGYLNNVVTVANDLTISLYDLTPADNSPLIGHADATAQTTPDLRGRNRGLTPDIGAVQRTPAPPAPTGLITQIKVDGQRVIVTGTTTGAVDSATATLQAAAVANGASTQGPQAVIATAGTVTTQFNNVPIGSYVGVQMALTNAGGQTLINSTGGVEILGLEGTPQAPELVTAPV